MPNCHVIAIATSCDGSRTRQGADGELVAGYVSWLDGPINVVLASAYIDVSLDHPEAVCTHRRRRFDRKLAGMMREAELAMAFRLNWKADAPPP